MSAKVLFLIVITASEPPGYLKRKVVKKATLKKKNSFCYTIADAAKKLHNRNIKGTHITNLDTKKRWLIDNKPVTHGL